MLKTPILHPQILHALGRAGHSSKILISDGNYPHHTKRGPNADIVFLNFAPGQMNVTDVLIGIANTVPIELAEVMEPQRAGPQAMKNDPPVFEEFRKILTLTIATGEQRLYANILLTIGVVGGV